MLTNFSECNLKSWESVGTKKEPENDAKLKLYNIKDNLKC